YCQRLGQLDPEANVLIGRCKRNLDMMISLKTAPHCNKCCTENLCNSGYCSSLLRPTNTSTPLTHPTSTQ
ncbi:hypothetical protein ACJMK2_026511, partial [Sinanodonta woodiana]